MTLRGLLIYAALCVAVVGTAVIVANDPVVSRWNAVPSPRSTVVVAPADVQKYVDAFCRGDASYLAANTRLPGVDESAIAAYFASDPAVCTGSRYLGGVTDVKRVRHVFVLTYSGGRADWIVITWDGALTGLDRG